MLEQFFQTTPIPANQITGVYSIPLVILSYLICIIASYVALDIAGRMKDVTLNRFDSNIWLIGGSFAMGAGIWSMHFIGMQAFIMPMPMNYDIWLTTLSMIVAVIASSITFTLLKSRTIKLYGLIFGGIILGFAIASMHYIGMAAMKGHMEIRYIPSIFFLSIIIAIVASEAALYLATISTRNYKPNFLLKFFSALIMAAAICGMHYTGMAAAVFTPLHEMTPITGANPEVLSVIVAMVTIFILAIAIAVSSFKEALAAKTVAVARQSGMAEVASSVLHNVGNVLNSINISSTVMNKHLEKIEIEKLDKINLLIEENKSNLAEFMTTDERGSRLPNYLCTLARKWGAEKQSLIDELKRMEEYIQHIMGIISLQQSMSGIMDFSELVPLDKIIEESLMLASIDFSKHKITLKKEYGKLKPVYVDKLKLTQVLINLIRNARESLLESSHPDKQILIKTGIHDDNNMFFIEIKDNGVGISPANYPKLFLYGFTTKKSGHGFGLHSCLISINEMKGNLSATSDGVDKGATFLIRLPYSATAKA